VRAHPLPPPRADRAQASLHFCADCNNLLYPKADPGRRQMVYACRICEYEEDVPNKCVYKNDLLTVAKCVPVAWNSHGG
jgi:hypothetical protein